MRCTKVIKCKWQPQEAVLGFVELRGMDSDVAGPCSVLRVLQGTPVSSSRQQTRLAFLAKASIEETLAFSTD